MGRGRGRAFLKRQGRPKEDTSPERRGRGGGHLQVSVVLRPYSQQAGDPCTTERTQEETDWTVSSCVAQWCMDLRWLHKLHVSSLIGLDILQVYSMFSAPLPGTRCGRLRAGTHVGTETTASFRVADCPLPARGAGNRPRRNWLSLRFPRRLHAHTHFLFVRPAGRLPRGCVGARSSPCQP